METRSHLRVWLHLHKEDGKSFRRWEHIYMLLTLRFLRARWTLYSFLSP